MEAGKLNRKITLQIKTVIFDTDGYRTETWADVATVWAEMITTGGKELYAAQRMNDETNAVFRIRYRSDLNADMRLKLGDRIFAILPPLNDVNGKRVEMLITAKELLP